MQRLHTSNKRRTRFQIPLKRQEHADVTPLIVHVVHALRIGGLENGLVNLINMMPPERYRHAVVCLKDYDDFAERIERKDVVVIGLNKQEGQDIKLYPRLWRCFRNLQPDIVHTRNLSTIEAQIPAFAAGVMGRIHGEHGRDIPDLDGTNSKHRWLRKAHRPLVHHFVTLSDDLEAYLRIRVGVPTARLTVIRNGVDTERFRPASGDHESRMDEMGFPKGAILIGTVGRMEAVKDPLNLVHAFALLLDKWPMLRHRLRLVMVGGGSLYKKVRETIASQGIGDLAWLPGPRDDIPAIYRALDIFALPSLAEGMSNTILEAMASGLPVIATRVGGNPELVDEGSTGFLVPPSDSAALADAMSRYIESFDLWAAHGQAARRRALREFTMERMIQQYLNIYDSVTPQKRFTLSHAFR